MPEEVKDAKAAESSTADTIEGEKETAAAGEKAEGAEKAPFHTHPRWIELQGELKAYKALGASPLEIKATLARLEQLEAAAEEAEKKAKSAEDESEEERELNRRRKAARKELSKIAPEVDVVSELGGSVNLFYKSLEKRAAKEMTVVMKEAGLPTEKKNVNAMEEIIANIIGADEDLYYEYIGDPKGAVREAFKQFSEGFRSVAERDLKANLQKNKAKLLGLPKTHKDTGGAAVGGAADKGPKNLAEARKMAEARLAALDGE